MSTSHDIGTAGKFDSENVAVAVVIMSLCAIELYRAGGTGPVGQVMAGPTFWQNYTIFVSTRHISGPQNFRSLLLEGF